MQQTILPVTVPAGHPLRAMAEERAARVSRALRLDGIDLDVDTDAPAQPEALATHANMLVYITIGNSDNRLTQEEWCNFWHAVQVQCQAHAEVIHVAGLSLPHAPWQNAVWGVELDPPGYRELHTALGHLARVYKQDSICWAPGKATFVHPLPDHSTTQV